MKLMEGIWNISEKLCWKQQANRMQDCRMPNQSTSKTPMTEIDVNYCNIFRISEHWNALQYPVYSLAEERGEPKLLVLSACIHFSVSHLGQYFSYSCSTLFSVSSPYLLHCTLSLDLRLISYNNIKKNSVALVRERTNNIFLYISTWHRFPSILTAW